MDNPGMGECLATDREAALKENDSDDLRNLHEGRSEDDNEGCSEDDNEGCSEDDNEGRSEDDNPTNFPELPAHEDRVPEEPESDSEEERFADEGDSENTPPSKTQWREDFPYEAGQRIRREPTMFEVLHNARVAKGESIWGAFSDKDDWALAQWILKSGTSHALVDELLKLKKVRQKALWNTGLTKA